MRAGLAVCAAALWSGAGAAAAEPYVVCDNGLRCVRAPCPSTNALDLASGTVLRVSGVDLARLSRQERDRAEGENATYDGSLVLAGAVVDTMANDAGKARPVPIFVATRILRTAQAAERRQCQSEKAGDK